MKNAQNDATIFARANKDLQHLYEFLKANNPLITRDLNELCIKWIFIPPRTPNFGGIWDANIKSVKRHLFKTTGETVLTL